MQRDSQRNTLLIFMSCDHKGSERTEEITAHTCFTTPTMDIAERYIDETNRQQKAKLRYSLHNNKDIVVNVDEDTALVDGIGGTTWEGALVLAHVMETIAACADNADDVGHCHVLEVGCGTGILGIVTHKLGFRTTITDRVVDLAAHNLQQNEAVVAASPTRKRRAFSSDDSNYNKTCKSRTQELMHSVDPDYPIEEDLSRTLRVAEKRSYSFAEQVQVVALPWGNNLFLQHLQQQTFAAPSLSTVPQSINEAVAGFHQHQATSGASASAIADIWNVPRVCRERGNVDIVVGAEITCLRKQQTLLIETICDVARQNPKVVVLLTFDGLYGGSNAATAASKYERDFLEQMKAQRFRYSVITQATIRWRPTATNGHKIATLETHPVAASDSTTVAPSVVFPRPAVTSASSAMDVDADDDTGAFDDVFHHHVIAFYRSDATLTCQRCHREFFAQSNHRSPSQTGNLFNPLQGLTQCSLAQDDRCRYHSGLYVCRRHPAETRCSINGLGDQLGYYGTGQEGWKAEFWDCCGAEDPQAAGCCVDRHIPY